MITDLDNRTFLWQEENVNATAIFNTQTMVLQGKDGMVVFPLSEDSGNGEPIATTITGFRSKQKILSLFQEVFVNMSDPEKDHIAKAVASARKIEIQTEIRDLERSIKRLERKKNALASELRKIG